MNIQILPPDYDDPRYAWTIQEWKETLRGGHWVDTDTPIGCNDEEDGMKLAEAEFLKFKGSFDPGEYRLVAFEVHGDREDTWYEIVRTNTVEIEEPTK